MIDKQKITKRKSNKAKTKKNVSVKKPAVKKVVKKLPGKKNVSDSIMGSEKKLKQIWLAGIGAYGMSVDSLQEKVGEMRAERKEIFDSLVERGEQIQDETNEALSQKIDVVEGRIEKIKQQLSESYSASKIAQGVEQMATRLEKIKHTKR